MRGLRSLIVLLVIAIPLGWYAYRDSTKPAGRRRAEDGQGLHRRGGQDRGDLRSSRSRASRRGCRSPAPSGRSSRRPASQPDANEVSGITSDIASLEVQRVVDENPPDLKEYGLAQPRIEVTFKADGKEQTLLIGQKTPPAPISTRSAAATTKVFLIPSHLESTFNKTTFDLRDKAVLKVDRDKLDALEFTAGDQTARFVKPAGEWQIAAPVQARADFSRHRGHRRPADRAADEVDRRRARRRIRRSTALDKPAATVRFGTGSSQAALVIGGPAGRRHASTRRICRGRRSSRSNRASSTN